MKEEIIKLENDRIEKRYFVGSKHSDDRFFIKRIFDKNGKPDGSCEEYYADTGIMCAKYTYKQGLLDGLYEEFTKTGKPYIKCTYKNGDKEGVSERYYPNGQIHIRETYHNDKINGLSEWYFENGILADRTNYKDDQKHGLSEQYYENGKIQCRCNYKNGRLDGLFEKYDKNGRVIAKCIYEDGKVIEDKLKVGRKGLCALLNGVDKVIPPSEIRQKTKRGIGAIYRRLSSTR